MELNQLWTYLGYAVGIAGGFVMLFSRVKNENLKDLKDRVEILESERKSMREEYIANKVALGKLQGKLDAYREIPLKFIPDALDRLNASNDNILQALRDSASISSREAHGGGLLVKTKKKI